MNKNAVSNKIIGKDEAERLILDYERKDASMTGKLGYLRSAGTIAKVRIISFLKNGESRVNAIERQYKEYALMKPGNYTRFTFCIEYAMSHPLLMDDEQRLRNFCGSIIPDGSRLSVYTAVNESLEDKILLTIIASK